MIYYQLSYIFIALFLLSFSKGQESLFDLQPNNGARSPLNNIIPDEDDSFNEILLPNVPPSRRVKNSDSVVDRSARSRFEYPIPPPDNSNVRKASRRFDDNDDEDVSLFERGAQFQVSTRPRNLRDSSSRRSRTEPNSRNSVLRRSRITAERQRSLFDQERSRQENNRNRQFALPPAPPDFDEDDDDFDIEENNSRESDYSQFAISQNSDQQTYHGQDHKGGGEKGYHSKENTENEEDEEDDDFPPFPLPPSPPPNDATARPTYNNNNSPPQNPTSFDVPAIPARDVTAGYSDFLNFAQNPTQPIQQPQAPPQYQNYRTPQASPQQFPAQSYGAPQASPSQQFPAQSYGAPQASAPVAQDVGQGYGAPQASAPVAQDFSQGYGAPQAPASVAQDVGQGYGAPSFDDRIDYMTAPANNPRQSTQRIDRGYNAPRSPPIRQQPASSPAQSYGPPRSPPVSAPVQSPIAAAPVYYQQQQVAQTVPITTTQFQVAQTPTVFTQAQVVAQPVVQTVAQPTVAIQAAPAPTYVVQAAPQTHHHGYGSSAPLQSAPGFRPSRWEFRARCLFGCTISHHKRVKK